MFEIKKLTTTLVALGMLASCSVEELGEMQSDSDFDPSKTYITVPDFETEDQSRTAFDIDDIGAHFKWSKNDIVGIVPDVGDQARFEIVPDAAGSSTAEFDGGAWALRPLHQYYAYYPFSKANFDNARVSDPVSAVFTGQKQKKAGQTEHLGAADYMAAAVTTPEQGALKFTFKHLCALVKIDVVAPATTTYSSLTMIAETGGFVTEGQFVLTDVPIAIIPTETSDRMTLELSSIQINEGETASLFLMVAPTDLSANGTLRVELTSTNGLKYATSVEAKNFVAGKAYYLNANFTGLDMTAFSFANSTSTDIDRTSGIITVKMAYGSTLTDLKANFTVPAGAEVYVGDTKQTSGSTSNDFSRPVKYTVKYNGIEKEYVVAIGYSSIPVLYINTPAEITSKEIWVEGSTLYMVNAGKNNAIYESANMRGRGNSTWGYPKKPYAIKLNKKAKVLGMPEHKRWVLLANYIDPTCLRNAAAFEIGKRAEGLAWTPRGFFVDVVLNGKFNGNYYLCEQIKVDKNRVNIKEMSATDLDEVSITGGFLCELDVNFDEPETNKFRTQFGQDRRGNTGMPVMIKDPDEEVIQPAQLAYIENYFYQLESLLYASDFPANHEYMELLDINSFIDWWLVTEIIQNEEPSWPKSSYMYKDRGGKLCAGPIWDHDYATFKSSSKGWLLIRNAIYYKYLFNDPDFQKALQVRWATLKTNLADITTTMSKIAAETRESVIYNYKIWPVINGINDYATLSFDDAVVALNNSITNRIAWMDSKISILDFSEDAN